VREPYRRAASLFHLFQSDARKRAPWTRDQPPEAARDFGAFVAAVLHGRELFSPTFQWTLCEWLRHAPEGVDVRVIRLERLAEGLLELGIVSRPTQVPVRNRSKRSEWRSLYADVAAAEGVRRWAREDFARFGYPEELPA
jgi:hypothetical protein